MKFFPRATIGTVLSFLAGSTAFAYTPTMVDQLMIDGIKTKIQTMAYQTPSKLHDVSVKIEKIAKTINDDTREAYIIDAILENIYESMTSLDEVSNWLTFSSDGLHISYPNDGTYSIEIPDTHTPGTPLNHFVITQEHPGQRFHITRVDTVIQKMMTHKTINERKYDMFYAVGMGNGYGYVTEYKGKNIVFRSLYGEENEMFEKIMQTVRFDKTSPFTDRVNRRDY